jgi:hypothetical protein
MSSLRLDIQEGSDDSLELALENTSNAPLTLYGHALPWNGRNSIVLVAVQMDALGTLLTKEFVVDDPGVARITIKPGEVLKGKIELATRFPGFAAAARERGVVVFWSYQPLLANGLPLERVSGHVSFPRSQPW